jgi:primosomal protein N' (replication factor Y)
VAQPVHERRAAAEVQPVARVAVDVSLSHLDRPFDYRVPAELADAVVPGCRVRVRFAGRLVDGFVLERVDESEHGGRLAFLDKVVSSEPVLRPEVAELARAVADRYAGTLADVLRLAVPPRHARVEAASSPTPGPPDSTRPDDAGWRPYPNGPAYLAALAEGKPARAVLTVLPGEDWAARLAEAAAVTVQSGRGVVAVVHCPEWTTRHAQRGTRAGRTVPAVPAGQPSGHPLCDRYPGRRLRPDGQPRAGRDLG